MANQNDFLPFAAASGANVLDQTDFENLPTLAQGFIKGEVASADFNKLLRQHSIISWAVAQFISNQLAVDVLDNGDLTTLLTYFTSAFAGNNYPAPYALSATPGITQVALSWLYNYDPATVFDVYQGTTSGGESPTPIATGLSVTSYTVTGLTPGTSYFFYVKARKGSLVSPPSNQASAAPPVTASVYFGFTASPTPNASAVSALNNRQATGFSGDYTLTQPGTTPQYMCLAFPATFGAPDGFDINGFVYQFDGTTVTISSVLYNVYTNSYATQATSVEVTVI